MQSVSTFFKEENDIFYRKGVNVRVERGVDIGIQKGVDIGAEKKSQAAVRNLIIKKTLSDQEIAEIIEVSIDFVKEIRERLNASGK